MSETAAEVIDRDWATAIWRSMVNCTSLPTELAAGLATAGLLCTPAERALIDVLLVWHAGRGGATELHAAADRVLAERTPTDEPDTTNEGDRG